MIEQGTGNEMSDRADGGLIKRLTCGTAEAYEGEGDGHAIESAGENGEVH